jgi:predicted GNAT superfamily acetyltransferase
VPLPLTPPQGEERLAWRMAVRTALQEAFAAGYRATDFLKQDDTCGYVLERLG